MIRWPGMQAFDLLVLKKTETKLDIRSWSAARHWTIVWRDWDRDGLWVAPRWIGWLYRLLPSHFNVNLTAWKTEPSHFLANVAAPTWRIGLLVRGGLPVVLVEFGGTGHEKRHRFYLPWGGARLYRRIRSRAEK